MSCKNFMKYIILIQLDNICEQVLKSLFLWFPCLNNHILKESRKIWISEKFDPWQNVSSKNFSPGKTEPRKWVPKNRSRKYVPKMSSDCWRRRSFKMEGDGRIPRRMKQGPDGKMVSTKLTLYAGMKKDTLDLLDSAPKRIRFLITKARLARGLWLA